MGISSMGATSEVSVWPLPIYYSLPKRQGPSERIIPTIKYVHHSYTFRKWPQTQWTHWRLDFSQNSVYYLTFIIHHPGREATMMFWNANSAPDRAWNQTLDKTCVFKGFIFLFGEIYRCICFKCKKMLFSKRLCLQKSISLKRMLDIKLCVYGISKLFKNGASGHRLPLERNHVENSRLKESYKCVNWKKEMEIVLEDVK